MFRKLVFVLMIGTILIFPFFTSYAAGDPMTAYGYQISIVKYDGTGSPTQVGTPILVYHPDLFGDVYRHNSVSLPTSYDSLVSKKWGLSQIVDIENDAWQGAQSYNPGSGGWTDLEPDDFLVYGLNQNPNTGTYSTIVDRFGNVIKGYPDVYYFTQDQTNCNSYYADDVKYSVYKANRSGRSGFYEFTLSYQTGDRKITYYGSTAKDAAKKKYNGRIYEDSNLTEYNVNNNNYLDTIIENVYFKDMSSVYKYFGITLNYSDIDKYYVQVEPVQRVLGKITALTGSYYISQVVRTDEPESVWDKDDWTSEWNKPSYTCACGSKECYRTNTTTGLVEYYDCNNCSCGDGYYTYSLSFQKCGIKQYHKFYGKYAVGYSDVQVSRNIGSSSTFLSRALNQCNTKWSEHNELDINNNPIPNKFQYYIGPSLEKALVGNTSNNYYLLIGNCVPSNVSGNRATGIKHYYLENLISCANTCENSGYSKNSDGFLKCAENYCDAEVDFDLKGNARIRKKDCILQCGYTYGKSPTTGSTTDPDRESVNSCNNSSPYKDIQKNNVIVSTSSSCGVDGSGKNTEETKGIIADCVGDQITDFDGNDSNDKIFDQRKYINIACKESSTFGFVDLSTKKLVAGQGIDYWSKLIGEKECTVYFNLEQWKFDYATVSSKDPDRRKRLLYIYTVYNNALNDNYDRTSNEYYDPDFLAAGDGEVNWSKYEYDISKTSVYSKVVEVVNNVMQKLNDVTNHQLNIESKNEYVNANVVDNKEKITQIYNLNVVSKPVNRYVQTSSAKVYYKFDKYCVTNDGLATVYKAPQNGVCYVKGSGVNAENVLGRNVYYTDLNATPNREFTNPTYEHSVNTTVSVDQSKADGEILSGNAYYSDDESCPYEIDSDDGLQCYIVIESNSGTEMHGNDIYANGSVTATLKYFENLGADDEVSEVGLIKEGTATLSPNGVSSLTVSISDKRDGVEDITISGIVKTKNGRQVTCTKKVTIIDPSPSCNVSCGMEKYDGNDLLYEIKSTGRANPSEYSTALSTNMNWRKVLPDVLTNKYLVKLSRALGNSYSMNGSLVYDDTIVYGKVKGTMSDGSGACYNVCWTEPPTLPNCTSSCLPSDTGEVKNHCDKYWNSDVNNYDSVDDCITRCSDARSCPDETRDLDVVESFCEANYKELGYSKASNCINYCYYCPECSSNYIYRSVNNYNPFPNSYDSNSLGFGYQTGDRIIG